jgi:Ca2+-binding RTX toxin-like protein
MSTTKWTNPETGKEYPIGYEGVEHSIEKDTALAFVADIFRATYPGLPIISALAVGLLDWNGDSVIPTYGSWAGPGWSGGERSSTINWEVLPCYNENIKQIGTIPDPNLNNYVSLVDAICKAHDWRYDQAADLYVKGSADYVNAIKNADVIMLQEIAAAYTSGKYQEVVGSWDKQLFTNTFDVEEIAYLRKLVPLFFGKIFFENPTADDLSKAYTAVTAMLSIIPIDGTVIQDPSNPSNKTIYHLTNDMMITQKETASTTNAWIMSLNATAGTKPVNVAITYAEGSTKAEDVFVIAADKTIRINGGSGNDEIKIVGAENADNSIYKFEIVGGDGNDNIEGSDGNDIINGGIGNDTLKGGKGNDTLYGGDGNDTYYVEADGSIDKIEDKQGINTVFISGKKITDFYWDADSSQYKSLDGEVVGVKSGTDFIVTYDGTQVILNEDFLFGDFGIDLIDRPDALQELAQPNDPPINGDYEAYDFDPTQEGIQADYDQWGNVIPDPAKPLAGRVDTLYDTTGNDAIYGYGGNDYISASRGGDNFLFGGDGNDHITTSGTGNNKIEGGTGDDLISTYNSGENNIQGNDGNDLIDGNSSTNCLVEGGAGSDIIFGSSTGDNNLFGDVYGEMDDLIAAGETAGDNGLRGDLIASGSTNGVNFIYGTNGYDLLMARNGALLVAGAGNDLILTDYAYNLVAYSTDETYTWAFSIQVEQTEEGNTSHTAVITGISGYPVGNVVGDDDVAYAGTGNDFVNTGGGDDEVYGGAGNDTVFGDAGHDFIEGGDGDDILVGDNGTLLAPELNGNDYIDGGAGNDELQGDGGNDELFGGADNDTLRGNDGDDYLDGEDGMDILYGGNGIDVMFGGADNDTINGGEGDDYLDGEAGLNSLYGGGGNDEMFGGDEADFLQGDDADSTQGNDYLDGLGGDDTLVGAGGDDTLFGGEGNDSLHGDVDGVTPGNDYLDGEGGDDYLLGYGGNDEMFGGAGNDTLYGMDGDDYLDGEAGLNMLYGGGGNDTIFGGDDNDRLDGDHVDSTQGNDYLDGLGGDDTLVGAGGADTLYGGEGNDQLHGDGGDIADGNDYLNGEGGNDTLQGYAGNDTLYGGDGADYLDGGLGDDVLAGGAGDDELIGGNGSDTYVFGKGDGSDLIWNTRTEGTIDTVKLGVNIDDVTITQNGNLIISINETTDKLTIMNWYWDYAANVVEQIQFADDTVLTWLEIEGKISSMIYGTSSSDIIYGDSSRNVIYGYEGNDTISGGDENDYLYGGSGNDYLYGETGNDIMDGGAGSDYLQGTTGSDKYIFGLGYGADIVYDYDTNLSNVDTVIFNSDTLPENVVLNRSGNDLLITIAGTSDTMTITGWFDTSGAYKVEQLRFSNDTIWDAAYIEQNAIAIGSAGNDTLTGTADNDLLSGMGGNDLLYGLEGNDTLDGGTGIDTMIGGAGNDVYIVDNTGDVVTENNNEGIDTVQSNVTYTLGANIENLTLTGTSQIYGTGNSLDNVITGNSNWNQLSGGEGNDTISGEAGYGNLYGNEGDDLLIGGNSLGANFLDGGSGADTMIGGGAGLNTYVVDNIGDVVIENGGYYHSATIKSSITYTLGAIVENLTLTGTAAINGTGNELNNYMIGNSGDNYLIGGDGNDTLLGWHGNNETGNDTLDGGIGNDVLSNGDCPSWGDTTYIFGRGYGQDYIANNKYFIRSEVDKIILGTDISPADVSLRREANGDLVLSINGTTDTLTMANWLEASGSHRIDYIQFYDSTIWDVQTMLQMTAINGTSGNDTLLGTATTDNINGFAGNDIIYGYSGYDTLDGGSGADTMIGGTEDDTYIVDNAGDVVTENVNEGTDNVKSSITYTLGTDLENLTLTGDAAINGTGNTLNNYILGNSAVNTLTGGDGADTLDGGEGADKLIGGLGNDLYIVDNTGDTITETSKGATDSVQSSVTYTLGAYVENLTLTGTAAINGTGNTLNNILTGNGADNTLTGGAGNDTLDGGVGADTLIGNAGNDTYIVDNDGDVVTEIASAGTDLVQIQGSSVVSYTLGNNVENLTLIGGSNATGNSLANVITGNWANNIINGGAGADKMIGGNGDDIYIVDNVKDVITENLNEGTDLVQSSVTFTLSANVENLTLTGTSAINGTGNALHNYINGNGANNTLTGNDGSDTLDGGIGADNLVGGAGDDTYIIDNAGDIVTERSGYGTDTVVSSISYTLPSNVENLILMGTSAINGTGNTLSNYIIGNSAVNILAGGDGNDTLDGGAGNDTISGGVGEDSLYGGEGNDSLSGDAGNDLLVGDLGNDILSGGNGSDSYYFNRTDGQNTIIETAGVSGDIDNLYLTDGITRTEPVLVKQNNDLYVFIDANNYTKITSEFQETNYGIEKLVVSDGYYITRQDIEVIINTMSAINNDSGMDVMQKYNAMMADQQYHNILAQSWQQIPPPPR